MTGKKRLERIIQMQYDGYTIWDMGENDLVWLIEQAGRVQDLERANKQLERQAPGVELDLLNMELTDALKQNKCYREAIEKIKSRIPIKYEQEIELSAALIGIADEIEHLYKALEGEEW